MLSREVKNRIFPTNHFLNILWSMLFFFFNLFIYLFNLLSFYLY